MDTYITMIASEWKKNSDLAEKYCDTTEYDLWRYHAFMANSILMGIHKSPFTSDILAEIDRLETAD